MKRRTFCCLLHASDCAEEVEVVVEQYPKRLSVTGLTTEYAYRLVSHSPRCRCGEPLVHVDPSQEQLRTAWNLNEAEDV